MTANNRITITVPSGVLAMINSLAHEGESTQSVVQRYLIPVVEQEVQRRIVENEEAELRRAKLENSVLVGRKLKAREAALLSAIRDAMGNSLPEPLASVINRIHQLLTD
jgi:hypothetical protein